MVNNLTTQKMVQKIKGWTYEEIQTKVAQEYDAWAEIAMNKRPLLRSYIKSYNVNGDSLKDWETVKSKSLYTYRNLFVSSLYKNRPLVKIEWRKRWDSEYAKTWNHLLEFDYDEMDEDRITYKKIEDEVDFWIYLAVDEWWDKVTETPKKRLYSPLCWIPDPYFDVVKGFNFHGFELELTEWEVSDLYSNTEYMLTDAELKQLKEKLKSDYTQRLMTWADWYGIGEEFHTTKSNLKCYSVYRHFTKFNNRWYLTEWANDRTLLIRCEEVEAVRAEEKKDPTLIPCPVVHSWFLPKKWDPYGLCVWDLAKDNQDSEEKVMNLLIDKVHEETFSWITVYNPDVVDWKELAHRKLGKRKFVPSKWNLENRKVIENIQTQTSGTGDWYNLKNMIDQKSTKEIWFDEQSIWVYARTITATQSQLLQANQNVRLSTIFKVFLWGEKTYWDVLWYRSYQKNFKMKSEKNITLNNWLWSVVYTIMWKDLDTKRDLHLTLVTEIDRREQEEANKAAFMASYQPLMEQANQFWKIILTKDFAKVMGMDDELVDSIYDYPPEYDKAILDLELLNNDEDVGEITDMNENHKIYIQVYQQALDTKAKKKAIMRRKQALILSWQANNEAMMQWMGQMQGASQNQLVSNYISQENQANNQPLALWPTAWNDIPTE